MNRKRNWSAAAELAVVLLVTVIAFTWGKRAALAERGCTACGGEYLLLLIPVIYYPGKRTAMDWIMKIRALWRNEDYE